MNFLIKNLFGFIVFTSFILKSFSQSGSEKTVWLSDLDLTKMTCVMGVPKVNTAITGSTLRIGGEEFERGVGTHAYSRMLIQLNGTAKYFTAKVGLDDAAYIAASITFYVVGDKKILWQSGSFKKGDKAKNINIDIKGVKKIGLLVTVNREDISENYADWAEAKIIYSGIKPYAMDNMVKSEQFGILTPAPSKKPQINSPAVYGVHLGSPVLYRIPTTGLRPLTYKAINLPQGLELDKAKGIITGKINQTGNYKILLAAKNKYGEVKKVFTIVVGEQLALTPPMGWNSWYNYYNNVSDSVIRLASDELIRSGMADYGYEYVNIDDGWMKKIDSQAPEDSNSLRDVKGKILSNMFFPDMKALVSYIHSKGLKAGIYSSPGPKTCAGYTGSYKYELTDARTFAEWGFDFLKYDWCSYGSIAKNNSLQELKAPFELMNILLRNSGRDIVFNLCQYGMGDVWKWGAEVGHCWRTGPDLGTATGSFIPGFYNQGILNSSHWEYAKPGGWNDPDYINIGWVGTNKKGSFRKIDLTPNEQYSYMSMWSMMASPLFFSGNLSMLDSFSINVLCNSEVISVNQDVLGKQARIIRNDSSGMIMVKQLADDDLAVGLFNFPGSKTNPVDYFVWDENSNGAKKIKFSASDIGIKGKFRVRNLWTQKNCGEFEKYFEAEVPYHGVVLLKISQ